MARTAGEAHLRVDGLEPRVTKLETENHIQFKEVFYRLKRLVFLSGCENLNCKVLTLDNFCSWGG